MKKQISTIIAFAILLAHGSFAQNQQQANPYKTWSQSGAFAILTTPEGANLAAGVSVEQFPVLVRLDRDWFDFSKAKSQGDDVRFSSATGEPLAYEIEHWDAEKGTASIWVRVPRINGNEQQAIRMHWGKADAASESNPKAVFNESNGYLSVWHMTDGAKDAVGILESKDTGTTDAQGVIASARHFSGQQGILGGDQIAHYPTESNPHTTQAWFLAETPNTNVVGWGEEKAQAKVVMQFSGPPHVRMDCYFSDASVKSPDGSMSLGKWNHVVHTYQKGNSTVYINGVESVSNKSGTPLAIKQPTKLWIGGWQNRYSFQGNIDEVRVSKVTRPAEWVRLEFENQKPLNTLVGPLVQTGNVFALSAEKAVVEEGKDLVVKAKAGGARKIYWSMVRDGIEELVATDRFEYNFSAGRVKADEKVILRMKAVFASEVKTKDCLIMVKQVIPQPAFTLVAPSTWDGRKQIEVSPKISNMEAMKAKGVGNLTVEWSAGPMAVIKEASPEKLILKRSQNSGKLIVTARIHNGGPVVEQSCTIQVTEPKKDEWVARVPDKDEKPQEGQFYARDESNVGTLHYCGTLTEAADSVFLRVYADDKLVDTQTAKPDASQSYALSAKLKPGLIRYRIEFGTVKGGQETVRDQVGDLVCGDAYIIEGQSNALATDTREESPPETYEWIRSYGSPPQKPNETAGNLWCRPVWKARKGEKAELGWWGMELAKRLVESQKVPIFIINGAVGGTRIDQHQRNAENPTDLTTIYGRMLWRVQQAKMTHGIRAVLWHQGESDQGAAGPSGLYGWETYQSLFVDMAAGWKQDFPNVKQYYIFQIWPDACAMGGKQGAGDRLREKQRTLPERFSNMHIMSTLGITPPGGCHYPLVGWAEFARMIQPLIERDFYGKAPTESITPPNLRSVKFSGSAKDSITLEFDQPVLWTDALVSQFYLDGEKDKVASGAVSGNVVTLKLKEPTTAKTITYLKEASWNQNTLLVGGNGIAALTFCEVPIAN